MTETKTQIHNMSRDLWKAGFGVVMVLLWLSLIPRRHVTDVLGRLVTIRQQPPF